MKRLDTNALRKSVILYIALTMIIFMVFAISTAALMQQKRQKQNENEYKEKVDATINYIIDDYLRDYRYRLRGIVETTNLQSMVQQKDREALYRFLKPKWLIMNEEEEFLEMMQVHLADGTSLLRMHEPDLFGDELSSVRPMVKEIHALHKPLQGYETGKHKNVYRIMQPLFDANQTYIGAIEIGLNPSFILRAVRKINGFCGMMFIEEGSLKLNPTPSEFSIDGYKLQSQLSPELQKIAQVLKVQKHLLSDMEIHVGESEYFTHLVVLRDFKDIPKVKIIFFQKISKEGVSQGLLLFGTLLVMVLGFLLLIVLIYRRIGLYQEKVRGVYEEQLAKINESQEKFFDLYNNAPDMYVSVSAKDATILMCNQTLLDNTGYTREEVIGQPIFTMYHEDSLEEVKLAFKTFLETGSVYEKELMIKRKDGSKIDISLNANAVKDKEGNILHSSASWRDITTQKKLQEFSRRFEYAANGTGDGLWDWNLVTNEIYFAPSWKRQLGYKDEELQNSFESWQDNVHPEDIEQAIHNFSVNIKGETKFYESVHRLKHKDGHWVWILDRGQTIFDDDGKAVRMVGFHTDISKQKEFEELLRNAKQEFDLFMEYIPANILIKNEAGKIVYANKSANVFFNKESIIGLSASELLPEDAALSVAEFDAKVLEKGKHEDIKEFYNAKGELGVVRTLGFKIQVQESSAQVGLVMLDITQGYLDKKELKNKENVMIAQSRHAAIGEMISMIAHQWRQPISVIAMDANNILADIELELLEEATLKENALDIIRQTQELSKTIDDFRNFFKPESNPVSVSVKEVLTNALGVINKSLSNNNIEINIEGGISKEIVTFSRELMQVFVNIIKNAKEALAEKEMSEKKITISVQEREDGITIAICDNAGGVNDAIVESIFNPYFTTKGEKNGTGLGLYISKTIVENHLGGALSVKNSNGGACFEIALPYIIIQS